MPNSDGGYPINLNSSRDRNNAFHQNLAEIHSCFSTQKQLTIHPTTEEYQLSLKSGHYSYHVILTKYLMVRITTIIKTKAETRGEPP